MQRAWEVETSFRASSSGALVLSPKLQRAHVTRLLGPKAIYYIKP